ncbi:MAG: alpha/beta fold hydrolase [Cellvibrionaceae bacterium]
MTQPRSSWISNGLESLVHQLNSNDDQFDYDVIIVGSGYGGSIAASQLAGLEHQGRALKVCVLERGKEYLPGMFPSRMADLPEHTRFSTPNSAAPNGNRDGLFDIRVTPHLNTVIANGLGGGSLINAGVMIEPKARVFDQRWPASFRANARDELFDNLYNETRELLGASDQNGLNTIGRHSRHQAQPLAKHTQLKILASDKSQPEMYKTFRDAAITMAMEDKINSGGVSLNACNFCGDCATGCNHNAKDSLDTNLLVRAQQQGVELYTGAAVLKLETLALNSGEKGWQVHIAHTKSKLRKRQGAPFKVSAAKVILAAGSYGSTEILLRSHSKKLPFSNKLGANFSSNGDMLATIFDQKQAVNAVASENDQPTTRNVGPTITGMIDLRDHPQQLLIEEMAVPGALRRVYEEMVTTTNSLAQLMNADESEHHHGQPEQDPYSVDAEKIKRTSILAIMGDDGSNGALELLTDDDEDPLEGDGALKVHWSGLPDNPLFPHQVKVLTDLIRNSESGGSAQGNPAWSPLPESMERFLGQGGKGPQLTVHPLGGCAMGDDHHSGVVDEYGRVFDLSDPSSSTQVHDNLAVLDGAMIPTALGANPALSIAAISLRASRYLLSQWQYNSESNPQLNTETSTQSSAALTRPVFADKSSVTTSKPTKVEITERIGGRVKLTDANQQAIDCVVDITLRFKPKAILDFVHSSERVMDVNNESQLDEPVSRLRIFEKNTWQELIRVGASDTQFDQAAILVTPVRGTMEIMGRESTSYRQRVVSSLGAWLKNRGLRDIYQSFEKKVSNWLLQPSLPSTRSSSASQTNKEDSKQKRSLLDWFRDVKALGSRAGEIRTFDYQLSIDRPDGGWPAELGGFDQQQSSHAVIGHKHISYVQACNPMRQFEDMHLNVFPGLRPDNEQPNRNPAYLRFDSRFITHYNKPLIRVVDQQDQVTALADLGAFFAYFARILISIHLWSFRKPDDQLSGQPERLPGRIVGVPAPEITELCVDQTGIGLAVDLPVNIRLTRYAQGNSPLPPIVMIHGYSASGNTFTHGSINPNMARYFWKQGREVWVLDMRTSSGMPTAMLPWSFEDVAFADIPVAVDHICRTTGKEKVDIVAHCMGSAMLSMAILAPPENTAPYFQERTLLPKRINKTVLSQVGPRVVFSPENIFRAYSLSYIRQMMPFVFYQFKRSDAPSAAEELLDRLLSALPYPDGEFQQENPSTPWAKTAYVGTRHRMDALYGRTFSLANLSKQTLNKIDDIFGPLNMETLSQVIRFAMHERVVNKHGENEFVTNERLKKYWNFPTLSVHGDQNGLSDISTLGRMEETMKTAGRDYRTEVFKGFGHQDSLIGKNVQQNFDVINRFLLEPNNETSNSQNSVHHFTLAMPFSGPVIGSLQQKSGRTTLPISLGFDSQMHKPEFVLFIAVNRVDDGLRLASGDNLEITKTQLQQNVCLKFAQPKKDNWLKSECLINDTFKQADGILALVLDDQDLRLEDLQHRRVLPDNLWDLLELPPVAHDAQHQSLVDYLSTHLLGKHFREQLAKTLQGSMTELEPALIEYPFEPPQNTQFVVAACQYPPNMFDKRLAYGSYQRLSDHLDQQIRTSPAALTPQFAILMGDQVYTDPSAGMMDPTERFDRFVDAYHLWLQQRSVKSVLRRLPSFMMLDDHELLNDWDSAESTVGKASYGRDGKQAYWNFQRNLHQTPDKVDLLQHPLWYRFEQNGFDFFMLDSRSERHGRSVNHTDSNAGILPLAQAELLSKPQLDAFKLWLLERPSDDRPRFIVSPSMLLPRRLHSAQSPQSAILSDAWDGYPKTLFEVLNFIAEHDIKNLVFLSGDEHLSSLVDIHLTHSGKNTQTRVTSIHSSGLYSPLSFVNSKPELFAQRETFSSDAQVQCNVSAEFFPGDGFALISCYQQDSNWVMSCSFNREQGDETQLTHTRQMEGTNKLPTEA